MDNKTLTEAHKHTRNNYDELKSSRYCGCCCCMSIYPSAKVNRACCISMERDTFFCPLCGIDCVIGDASGYELTPEFLGAMNEHWFNGFTVERRKDTAMTSYKIKFLGTAAADFSPRLKGDCADCFDKNARRASCLLFNDQYLIDCGPHCLDSLRIAGIDKSHITDLFVTHLHSDHFNPDNIAAIAQARRSAGGENLRVWVSDGAKMPEIADVTVMPMVKFTAYTVEAGLTVTGLNANHDKAVHPQHLLFDNGGDKFFYGCDGAWLLNDTYAHLRKSPLKLMVLDGTCGDYDGDFRFAEHNTIPMIRVMLPSLRTVGIIDDNTALYISHLAPSLHKPHDETVEIMSEMGVGVAYDGLEIEV